MSAKQRKLLWPVLIAVAISCTALLFGSARTKTTVPRTDVPKTDRTVVAPQPEGGTPVETQNISAQEQVQALLITVHPGLLEPSEITVPAGKYLLAIQNRSGLRDMKFGLDTNLETGQRLHEVHDLQLRINWRQQVELVPGTYTLTEVAHPEMSCRITVTRK